MDSKLNQDPLPTSQTHDQLSAPVTANNKAFLDLQNPDKSVFRKSLGTSSLLEDALSVEAHSLQLLRKFQKLYPDPFTTSQTHDQLSAPVTTNNKASLDLQNHDKSVFPKFVGTSLLLEDALLEDARSVEAHSLQVLRKFQKLYPDPFSKSVVTSSLPTESVHSVEAHSLPLLQKLQKLNQDSFPKSVGLQALQRFRESMDSTVKDNRLDKSKTVSPKHDKQLSVPLTTKKTALRDLQNDNERVVPKSVGSSALLTESGSSVEAVKLSGTKRAPPESLLSSRHHSPGGNSANGHFVYVRRKPDIEPGKCSNDDSTSISPDDSQSKVNSHQDEHIKEHLQEKESDILVPEALNLDRSSSECVSRAPAGPLPVANSSNTIPSTFSNQWQVRSSQPSLEYQKKTKVQHWEERYYQLQNLLKQSDSSSQEGYVQMLRSCSSVELSRHAVELEKRAIQLSLTEGREWQRVMLLDVLGKDPKNYKATSTQQEQSKVKGQ